MTYLFLDTEFTDFKHMDLISIGAISENGTHKFYKEVTNHIADYRSDFVKEVVIPLLNHNEFGASYDWTSFLFAEWLNVLPTENIVIIIDYTGDKILTEKLLEKNRPKKNISFMLVSDALTQVLQERRLYSEKNNTLAMNTFMDESENYYHQYDNRIHHALVDAKSNQHGWISALNKVST